MFRLTVLEILVHDPLALWLWAYHKERHHSGSAWQSKITYLMAREQKQSGGVQNLTITFKGTFPNDLKTSR